MSTRRALLVDAFTDAPLSGQAAGVVPDADGLSPPQLQAIARELGAEATAFVLPAAGGARRLRFFTPTAEVDRCVHGTVAAYGLLAAEGALEPGDHRVETAAVDRDVTVAADGTVWLGLGAPSVREVGVSAEAAGTAVDIDPAAIEAVELPLARASTGVPMVVVPVDYLASLGGATADPGAIAELCTSVDAAGIYACTFDTLDADATLHGRWFPTGGRPAGPPATGATAAAAGAYLRHVGAFAPLPDELTVEQGDFVDRPARLRVRVGETVHVGGQVAVALDGEVRVPELEADDIIEA